MEGLKTECAAAETGSKQLFETLYVQVFPKVARYISSRKGSFDDAKDIFQDALVIYYEQSREAGFNLRVSAEAYIIGIAKHLWLRRAQQNGRKTTLSEFATYIPVAEKEPDVNTKSLLHLLEATGKKCMDLLRSFYYKEATVKEIAQTLDYSSEHSASVQKYKCLEKIRDTVKEKSIPYEAFID